jgi:hypothetical protein
LSKQQFGLPTVAFQPQEKQCGIALQPVFLALVASAGTLQLIFVVPVALAVTLAVLHFRCKD